MGWQFVRQTFLMELFQALKIFDVTFVALLIAECVLAVDGGAIRDIALTENSSIIVCQVL